VFLLISLTGSLRGLLREPALRRRRQLARELRGAAAQGAGAGSRRCMPPHNHTPHNHNTTRARPSREWACLSVSYGGRGPSQIGGALPAVHAPTCSCATFSASLVATRPAPLTAPAPAADACGAARSVERGDCQLSGVNARAQHRPPRRDGSYRPLMISMPTTV
jgi:hypothetical protein